MNSDDFEQQLQRQPMQNVPAQWRREILEAARSQLSTPSSQLSYSWWHALLWPCPQAWAGLAAAWVLILGLHLVAGSESRSPARLVALPPSPEDRAVLAEQQRLFTELLAGPDTVPAQRPADPVDRPRSQREAPAGFPTSQWLELPHIDDRV